MLISSAQKSDSIIHLSSSGLSQDVNMVSWAMHWHFVVYPESLYPLINISPFLPSLPPGSYHSLCLLGPLRRSQCAALALAYILFFFKVYLIYSAVLITAAKLLQSCPTLCDPIDGSPAGSPVPGILQARTLEWVAISFSSA